MDNRCNPAFSGRRFLIAPANNALLFATLLLTTLVVPHAVTRLQLDSSWQAALSYLHDHHFRFGNQVLYTYGPLGYMMAGLYYGSHFKPLFIGHIIFAIFFALVSTLLVSKIHSKRLYGGLIITLFLFSPDLPDRVAVLDMIGILSVTFAALICFEDSHSLIRIILAGVVLSFMSLVKFTFLGLSCWSLICVLWFLLAKREYDRLLWLTASYASGLLTFWVFVAGQSLTDLPAFIRGSSEVARGYSEAMTLSAPSLLMTAGGFAAIALLGMLMIYFRTMNAQARWPVTLLLSGTAAFAWTQGFTRGDSSHLLVIPLVFPVLGVLISALMARTAKPGIACVLLLGVIVGDSCFILKLISMDQQFETLGSVTKACDLLRQRLRLLARPDEATRSLDSQIAAARSTWTLPNLKAIVQSGTVDVFGDDVDISLFNDLNYHPRPTLQSFAAYTASLQKLNETFAAGGNAPDFYLVQSSTIDQRLPLETDGPTLLAILANYKPIAEEKGFLLFKKSPLTTSSIRVEQRATGTGTFRQPIALTPSGPGVVDLLRVFLHPTTKGELALNHNWLILNLRRKSGRTLTVKLLPSLARIGFPVNPPIASETDLQAFLTGRADPLESLAVICPREFTDEFQSSFTYELDRKQLPIEARAEN